MNNWIEVSEPRLGHNLRTIAAAAGPDATVLAVVKANAYGHGVSTCAPMLARAGARWLGVTSAQEGAAVRVALGAASGAEHAGVRILVMSGVLPPAIPALIEHDLTPVVWTVEQLRWFAAAPVRVHVEVDTGMSRQGVKPGADLEALLAEIAEQATVQLDGVFTHFVSSEVVGSPITTHQQRLFEQALAQVARSGLRPAWVHAANTSAVDNAADPAWLPSLARSLGARTLVRTGLALYGHTLAPEGEPGHPHLHDRLKPVLTWKAGVLDIRDLAGGDRVGYNATFTAPSPMRVALLSVGYADGLRRELSGHTSGDGGWVMLHGKRAPILGRISMNLTTVDVTHIPEARTGDVAVVLGRGVSAEEHARIAGTIPYEILCGIHPCP
ncbi:alanine racemase [Granulicella rosea]|uniref:Alanine racemase n=1 Tax=Granulicella rosea TaxID=474952 RepID=A0A239D6S9_9BACT|nr:alanine racemase [Granulicella rosea]SNS28040.1 alanine racemase [Granulicella rosea]